MGLVLKTDFQDMKLVGRGKVRDIYDLGDSLLIVTTDRISAFDVILPNGVPDKGVVLTQLSKYWFDLTSDVVENHLLSTDVDEMPEVCHKYRDELEGRTMWVKKADPFPVECVVRGYISGSGWKDYQDTGSVCGIPLKDGLLESEAMDSPIFTPATKAEVGEHDENISFERMAEIVGQEKADALKKITLDIYKRGVEIAKEKGIIIADTKMEFGLIDGKIILIDELMTPDSSRFWFKESYAAGKAQESMDKQFVRNYLETLTWDKTAPGPELPEDLVVQTRERYMEIMDILTK